MIAAVATRALTAPRATALAWAFAALLVVWGNATTILFEPTAALPGGSLPYAIAGAALVAMSLAAARVSGLDATALGLRGDAPRGAAVGVTIGVAASVGSIVALRLIAPAIVGHALDYEPLATASGAVLAWHVGVVVALSVVLPEELAFRGVLVGALARDHGRGTAVAGSAAAFALWHGALVFGTVGRTTLGAASPWVPVAVAVAIVVLGAGGAIFAWLRLATGSLATSLAAHWAFNAVVLVGLWSTR